MLPIPRSTVRIELVARFAWLAAFVLPLLLAAALLGARGAGATPAASPPPAAHAFETEPGEEEGLGFCDLAQAELEEGWLSEAEFNAICAEEAAEQGVPEAQRESAAAECPLRSASAHAKATRQGRLKVTIGYTTHFPTRATIQLYAGQSRIATYKRQLSHSGVLRITKSLGKGRPQRIVVGFKTPFCKKFQIKSVKVR